MATFVRAFIAGFIATLLFHQGLFHVLHVAGVVSTTAWNMSPVPPLGVPSVLSLAFFGGLWGCLLWLLIRRTQGVKHWLLATVWGAILPSAVALAIVFPLKGVAVAAGGYPKLIVGALLLNGVWGLGVALLMKLMGRR
ncbi:MAG: hypothetical protein ACT4NL_04300 [Pseudomarimonas sp.]